MFEYLKYNADLEEPNCLQCDHICDDFKCDKWCGPEHGWWGYRSTEKIEIKE